MADRAKYMQRDDWRCLPYFHENFKSTDDVTHFIKKKAKNKPGYFLLRPSNRNRDLLTASVLVPDRSVRHTHIQIEDGGSNLGWKYFLVVEKKFDSIAQLVTYYKSNPVKNLENVNNVYLQNPICRADAALNLYTDQIGWSGGQFTGTRTMSMSSVSSRASEQSFDSVSNGPPPLPVRPMDRTQSQSGNSSTGTWGSTGSQVNLHPNDISNRPPMALPAAVNKKDDGGAYGYSRARDVEEDMSEKLKDVLKTNERCECGIPRHLAELPKGWTVHLSKDPQMVGKLFYQNNEGVTTWQLPLQVEMQLTNVHKSNLRQIDKTWCIRKGRSPTVQ